MKKQIIVFLTLLSFALIGLVPGGNIKSLNDSRKNYELFINKSGKEFCSKKTPQDKKNPGVDRPDEAAYAEFIKTLDPLTRSVPAGRRFEAIQETDRLLSMKNLSSELDWQSHKADMGGRTRTLMFDPNDPLKIGMYAGAVTGGLWYNDNPLEGHDWQAINDFWPNLSISCMTHDPKDTKILYVGTGESETALIVYRESSGRGSGIIKSSDGGKIWEVMPSTTDWAYVTDILVRDEDGQSVIYAGVVSGIYKGVGHQSGPSDGLYRSDNGGDDWTQVLPAIPGSDVPYAPSDISISSDKKRIFVGTTYGINSNSTDTNRSGAACILYSDDGINWTVNRGYHNSILLNDVSKYPGRVILADSESHSNIMYALVASGHPSGTFLGYGCKFLLKSTDKGETWTEINFPEGFATLAWHAFSIAINPEDPDCIWLGGLDTWRTIDGGANWLRMSNWAEMYGKGSSKYVHGDIHMFLYKPGNPREMYVATDGGVFVTGSSSSPDNVVFYERNYNYNTLQYYTCAIHPEEGRDQFIGGLQDNGTMLYLPGNTPTFREMLSGGDGAFCFIDKDEPNMTITTHQYCSTYLWDIESVSPSQPTAYENINAGTFINPMDYDWKNNMIYVNACYFNGELANNLGLIDVNNWEIQPVAKEISTNTSVPFSSIKWDENTGQNSSTIYMGSVSGRFYRIEDAETPGTLTELTADNFPKGYISSSDVGQSPDTLLTTFSNYGIESVWITVDGGDTWTSIEGNLPDMPVRWGIFHPESSEHIMLATETGTWTTDDALAAEVIWKP
ncbi:MAG: hypothetical protein HN686_05110, partial [Bacteroidetes bacterium]|nr:hypothetical protein [Bacteroidota bacterium]